MKYILFFAFGVFFVTTSLACDCEYVGNFLKATKSSEKIVKVKVLEHTFYSSGSDDIDDIEGLKVEVIEVIRGTENRKTIEIIGSDGIDCLSPIYFFEKDKTYIISLFSYEKDSKTIYSIWGCSEQWLEYLPRTNLVKGKIKGRSQNRRVRTFDYERLVKRLR